MFAHATAAAEARQRAVRMNEPKGARGRKIRGQSKKSQSLTFGQQQSRTRYEAPRLDEGHHPGIHNKMIQKSLKNIPDAFFFTNESLITILS